ncbi:hypothetical protein [Rhizobium sp.]
MHATTSGTAFADQNTHPFTTTGLIATIVGKWREYRMIRELESMPYTVMKDIGFRSE